MAQSMGRLAQRPLVRRSGWIEWLPGMLGGWTRTRSLRPIPPASFRDWYASRKEPRNDA
jgi:L-lactate dehydrogenase complex protein LldF